MNYLPTLEELQEELALLKVFLQGAEDTCAAGIQKGCETLPFVVEQIEAVTIAIQGMM